MKRILKIVLHLLIFSILTLITQIGGIVYLISLMTYGPVNRHIPGRLRRRFAKIGVFVAVYFFVTFVIVPVVARPFGRVPLPITEKGGLRPLMFLHAF